MDKRMLWGLMIVSGLLLTRFHSYLLFHSAAEMFSIAVAFTVFALAWHTRRIVQNSYLVFLGIGYLFISGVDFLHMLAYRGVGVFAAPDANLGIQLWLAARYMHALMFLAAPFLVKRQENAWRLFLPFALSAALFLLSVFYWRSFPNGWIAGTGLTPFKVGSEYVICLIFLASLCIHFRRRRAFAPDFFRLMIASIVLLIGAELSFTLYADPYDIFNVTGHLLKIASVYLVYAAIVEFGLSRPYDLLFKELTDYKELLEATVTERTAALAKWEEIFRQAPWGVVLADSESNVILGCNQFFAEMHGYAVEEMIGMSLADILAPESLAQLPMHAAVVHEGGCHTYESVHVRKDGSTFLALANVVAVKDKDGNIAYLAANVQDITERQQAVEKLHAQEKFLAVLFDNISEAVVSCDAEGRLVRFNRAARELHGLPETPILPDQWAEHYDLYEADGRTPLIKERIPLFAALQGETVRDMEMVVAPKQGQPRSLVASGQPLYDAAGRIAGAVVSMHDITERKQTELERQKFFMLAESSSEFIGMCDLDMQPLYVNPAGVRMVGLPDMFAACRVKVQDYFFPEDQAFIAEEFFPRVMRDGQGDVEIRLRHFQTGEAIWMFYYLFSVRDASGTAVGWATVSRDITERRKAEEEIRLANDELRTMNRIITVTTTEMGVKRILETALDEALAITGLEGGTICLVTPDDTLQLAVQRETSEAVIKDLTDNDVKIGDCLCGACARDHKPLILHNREAVLQFSTREVLRGEDIRFHAAFPLLSGEKCLGVLCAFTRTEKKPAERSLKLLETVSSQIAMALERAQLYEEITHYAATMEDQVRERTQSLENSQRALMNIVGDLNEKSNALNEANERLRELDRLKAMFIASMSHELRTPLNSIIGFTGIILQGMTGKITTEQRDQLRRVSRAGKHLLALINDVIDISKIEAGKIDIRVEEFDLGEVIHEAATALRAEMDEKGLDLQLDFPANLTLKTERKRLLQCLLNYLSNAVKFTLSGKIEVRAREVRDMVEIAVSDTGIGISREDMPKLFGSFVRLESPLKTTTLGTGLGLYLTKKLAEETLRGAVSVRSVYGEGSIFTLTIPREIDA